MVRAAEDLLADPARYTKVLSRPRLRPRPLQRSSAMKKIFCPKCDTAIPLRRERIEELQASGEDRLSIICPQCTHQLNLRLRLPSAKSTKRQEQRTSVGHIIVVENVFGYKQLFPLYVGVNAIGRRNKDTATDIPCHHLRPEYGSPSCDHQGHRGTHGEAPLRCGR